MRRLHRIAGALAAVWLALLVAILAAPRLTAPRPTPHYFTTERGDPCDCIFGVIPGLTDATTARQRFRAHPHAAPALTTADGYRSYTLFTRDYAAEAWDRPTVTSASLWLGYDNSAITLGELLVTYGPPPAVHIYLPDEQTAFVALAYPNLLVITDINRGWLRPDSTVYYVEFHNGTLNPESPTYLFNSRSVFQTDWLGLATLDRYMAHPSLEIVQLKD